MKNTLTLHFFNDNTRVDVYILDQKLGMFTLAEKLFQQISELYEQDTLTNEEIENHIGNFFASSSMNSNLIGRFGIFYKIYNLFPDIPFIMKNIVPEDIYLILVEDSYKYVFAIKESDGFITLGDYFSYQYEALDFLNFLFYSDCITRKQGEKFEKAIQNSFMYEGTKTEILN